MHRVFSSAEFLSTQLATRDIKIIATEKQIEKEEAKTNTIHLATHRERTGEERHEYRNHTVVLQQLECVDVLR